MRKRFWNSPGGMLAVVGLAFALWGGARQAFATGNNGACWMAEIKVNPDPGMPEPEWYHYDAECVGSCPQPNPTCGEYATGMQYTDQGGTVYDVYDCGCGVMLQGGIFSVMQTDTWHPVFGGPTPCRTVHGQSRSSTTPEYEISLCIDYTCAGTCSLSDAGIEHFDRLIDGVWTSCRYDKCNCQ